MINLSFCLPFFFLGTFQMGDKAFVINLDRSKKRLENSEREFQKAGMRVTRFPAIDGNHVDPQKLLSFRAWYNLQKVQPRTLHEQLGSKGTVGCYLSHIKLMELLIHDDQAESYLIFEDDVELTDHFKERLESALQTLPSDFDIALLGTCVRPPVSDLTNHGEWRRIRGVYYGNFGYIVSKQGARRLVEQAYPIEVQVDHFISYFIKLYPDFHAYLADPVLCWQRPSISGIQTYCTTDWNNEEEIFYRNKSSVPWLPILIILFVIMVLLIYLSTKFS